MSEKMTDWRQRALCAEQMMKIHKHNAERLSKEVQQLIFGRDAAEGEARQVHADYEQVVRERDEWKARWQALAEAAPEALDRITPDPT